MRMNRDNFPIFWPTLQHRARFESWEKSNSSLQIVSLITAPKKTLCTEKSQNNVVNTLFISTKTKKIPFSRCEEWQPCTIVSKWIAFGYHRAGLKSVFISPPVFKRLLSNAKPREQYETERSIKLQIQLNNSIINWHSQWKWRIINQRPVTKGD